VAGLLDHGDPYLVLADFEAYRLCQERVSRAYLDPEGWTRMAIRNVAAMGRFSSDRTIQEYAREIWGVRSVPVRLAKNPARPAAGGSKSAAKKPAAAPGKRQAAKPGGSRSRGAKRGGGR